LPSWRCYRVFVIHPSHPLDRVEQQEKQNIVNVATGFSSLFFGRSVAGKTKINDNRAQHQKDT